MTQLLKLLLRVHRVAAKYDSFWHVSPKFYKITVVNWLESVKQELTYQIEISINAVKNRLA